MPTPYCTVDDIASVLSSQGVDWSVDDDRSGTPNGDEPRFVDDCIERAQSDINFHLTRWYDLTTLPGNTWIKWCCATLASVKLMRRRGDSCPDGLVIEANEYLEQLKAVMDNRAIIPQDSPGDAQLLTQNAGMTMSNVGVDQRYRNAKVRVNPVISTGPANSKLPRFIDPNATRYPFP